MDGQDGQDKSKTGENQADDDAQCDNSPTSGPGQVTAVNTGFIFDKSTGLKLDTIGRMGRIKTKFGECPESSGLQIRNIM